MIIFYYSRITLYFSTALEIEIFFNFFFKFCFTARNQHFVFSLSVFFLFKTTYISLIALAMSKQKDLISLLHIE